MSFALSTLQSVVGQPLSRDRKVVARGFTSAVLAYSQGAIYKGIQADGYVRRPDLLVENLKRRQVLPEECWVQTEDFPGNRKMTRCVLYGLSFAELAKRADTIADWIDSPEGMEDSPLDGAETVALLTEMIFHAAIVSPGAYVRDAMLHGLLRAAGDPCTFEALSCGGGGGLDALIKALRQGEG
jgi:hypothetical protein